MAGNDGFARVVLLGGPFLYGVWKKYCEFVMTDGEPGVVAARVLVDGERQVVMDCQGGSGGPVAVGEADHSAGVEIAVVGVDAVVLLIADCGELERVGDMCDASGQRQICGHRREGNECGTAEAEPVVTGCVVPFAGPVVEGSKAGKGLAWAVESLGKEEGEEEFRREYGTVDRAEERVVASGVVWCSRTVRMQSAVSGFMQRWMVCLAKLESGSE